MGGFGGCINPGYPPLPQSVAVKLDCGSELEALGAEAEVDHKPGCLVRVRKDNTWFKGKVLGYVDKLGYHIDFAPWLPCWRLAYAHWVNRDDRVPSVGLPKHFSSIKMDISALHPKDTRWHIGALLAGDKRLKAMPVGEKDALPLEVLAQEECFKCQKHRCKAGEFQAYGNCSVAVRQTHACSVVQQTDKMGSGNELGIYVTGFMFHLDPPQDPPPYFVRPSPPLPRARGGRCPLPASGGCFSGDGLVAVGVHGERLRRVHEVKVGDRVFSPSLGRDVEVVATTLSLETRICKINGLRISRKHPVKTTPHGPWVMPEDITEGGVTELTEAIFTHNFVLSEGGTVSVNGMCVITLGDNESAALSPPHPFYGTSRVVDHLRTLPSWPECRWGCCLDDGSQWGEFDGKLLLDGEESKPTDLMVACATVCTARTVNSLKARAT